MSTWVPASGLPIVSLWPPHSLVHPAFRVWLCVHHSQLCLYCQSWNLCSLSPGILRTILISNKTNTECLIQIILNGYTYLEMLGLIPVLLPRIVFPYSFWFSFILLSRGDGSALFNFFLLLLLLSIAVVLGWKFLSLTQVRPVTDPQPCCCILTNKIDTVFVYWLISYFALLLMGFLFCILFSNWWLAGWYMLIWNSFSLPSSVCHLVTLIVQNDGCWWYP